MGETDKGRALHSVADVQFAGAEGEEVLGALDGVLEAAKQKLEVFAALDEVDLRGVDGRRRNSERKNVRRRGRPTLAAVGASLGKIEPLRGLLPSATSEMARGTTSLCGVGNGTSLGFFLDYLPSPMPAAASLPSLPARAC